MSCERKECPVIWYQAAACSGCSVSLLNGVAPDVRNLLLQELVPGKHVNLVFHVTVMAGQGKAVLDAMNSTARTKKGQYVLCVEGSLPSAAGGVFGEVGDEPMIDKVVELAKDAVAVVAVGTCAAFGGIPAAKPNYTGSKSVRDVLCGKGVKTPVVNVPGCPPHPDWIIGSVALFLQLGAGVLGALDEIARPVPYYGNLIHENCPRRPDFDAGKFAVKFGDPGCLYKLGCKGPMTYADCPTRQWNAGVNWCIGNGIPCQGCVEPEFIDGFSPIFDKITEERLERFKVRVS
ncbi:MAG: hydrogenase small subunit [Planctomycetota bacterium]